MKKTFLTSLIMIFSASTLLSQITSRDILEKAIPKPRSYDSLNAFDTKEDLRIYIGEELYFLPKSTKCENFKESSTIGYSDFSNSPRDPGNLKEYQYHAVQGTHQYDFKSDYNKIAGQYFIVDDFIDKTDRNKFNYNELGLYFKLINKEIRDTAYYQIAKVKQHLLSRMLIPFIVVGHFEHLKGLYMGQRFQAQQELTDIREINSGQSINCLKGSWWECVDLTLAELEDNIYSKPVLIFKNEKEEEILVEIPEYSVNLKAEKQFFLTPEEISEKERLEKLKEQEIAEQKKQEEKERFAREADRKRKAEEFRQDCISKYGSKYGDYIADGKVVIGMTKEMCRLAWGSPMNINTTTTKYGTNEQWVYSLKHYLYFDDSKLTAIQN
jgi:hypothetical protein